MAIPASLINIFILCAFGPIVTITLLFLYIYRRIVNVILWLQLRDRFAGLLEGTDCVWAIEEPTALSIINVLAVLEKERHQYNANFLDSFRCLAKDRLLLSRFEKLLYKRSKKYGYYYWERCEEIDLSKRVRWLDHDSSICDGFCDDIYGSGFKNILQNISNRPLPEDHSSSWEILICRCCSKSNNLHVRRVEDARYSLNDRARRNKVRIPILFRVHHSLGDGMALLRLLVESLADQEVGRETFVRIEDEEYKVTSRNGDYTEISVPVPSFNGKDSVMQSYEKDIVDWHYAVTASMPFTYFITLKLVGRSMQDYLEDRMKAFKLLSVEEVMLATKIYLTEKWNSFRRSVLDAVRDKMKRCARYLAIIVFIPMFLIQQAIRSMDNSALHGPSLTGEKLLTYWLEGDLRSSLDHKLVAKIRDIKNITGAKFVDVVLAALSSSLHKYFLRIKEAAPKTLTVVLPSQMEAPNASFNLQNGFSVGLLPLCLSNVNGETILNPDENSNVLDRLYDITRAHEELKEGPDYLINFWVIKFLCAALPEKFLRLVLESHSTMVLSNLPGSEEVQILGDPLKNVVFWVPHRCTTGIGCSVLSYGDNLHLSLVADKAVMKDEKLLSEILQNTIREIDELHDDLTSTCFSKTLQRSVSAAMEIEVGVL